MTFMKDREADLRDAPVAVEPIDVDEFPPEARESILGILVMLGDNKYQLGRRYGEWATSGPTLEASVAAASMTSDEMGHARSLYPLLRKFPGAPPELKKEDDRTAFHNVSFLDTPFLQWTDLIATAALFDRALSVLVEGLRDSSYGPFRHRAAKILQEERYHELYANGWVETLAQEEGTRIALKESMNRIWTETLTWFGPDDDRVLGIAAEQRIVDVTGPELRERFVSGVQRVVESIPGMGFPASAPLPWDRWVAADRRLRPE
jgi:phenylacetate-CoA oxygenase PaaI subunit